MSDFKWRHYQGNVILGCVRWYCKYGINYRKLEEMMLERGFEIGHTMLYRWVQHYVPEIEKRLQWYYKPTLGYSWRVDEAYVKVKGKWMYLYRAIDKRGHTIDFYLSPTPNTKAAKRFLDKALKFLESWAHPGAINTDKAPTYDAAITELKTEGQCLDDTVHRQVKYQNNIIEADHGKLKQLTNPIRGFKTMKISYATIKGFELMRMFKKGQMNAWKYGQGLIGEIRIFKRQFDIYTA
jgi:transposase, IS6 family